MHRCVDWEYAKIPKSFNTPLLDNPTSLLRWAGLVSAGASNDIIIPLQSFRVADGKHRNCLVHVSISTSYRSLPADYTNYAPIQQSTQRSVGSARESFRHAYRQMQTIRMVSAQVQPWIRLQIDARLQGWRDNASCPVPACMHASFPT